MTRETRLLGGFLVLLGMSAIVASAWALMTGAGALPTGLSCKALCGIGWIVGTSFGLQSGAVTAAGLQQCVGLGCAYIGLRILRNR